MATRERIAFLITCPLLGGCFPSFDGLSGGSRHDQIQPSDAAGDRVDVDESGDAASDAPHCTLEAGCSCEASCSPQNYAVYFSGNQLIRVGPSVVDDFTIEMWLKTTETWPGDVWYQGAALFQADKPGSVNDFGATLLGDVFAFGTGNPDITARSVTNVNTGEWTHVAATRAKSTGGARVYINGNLESIMATGNESSLTDAVAPWIGGVADSNTVYNGFVGSIDEVRVWSVVRTASEIVAAMHVRLTGKESDLVGYWKFDEGSGLTAFDSSPSKNDGSLGYTVADRAPAWVVSDAPVVP